MASDAGGWRQPVRQADSCDGPGGGEDCAVCGARCRAVRRSASSGARSWRPRRGDGWQQQIPDEQKAALCDYVLTNGGSLTELEWQVDQLWPILLDAAR